ncbi:MAG: hypothetical protein AB1695_10805 [Stygiobacter sp.]|jgi:hypothetical protein|uniref:HEPN domain-containing protein n=1 Tax=Stygiobacter electus TaxID=3032292 RepID=A0AAE3P0E3_9BACT|nr:hypothetical protein [Stygiobacter electus]MDF1612087.1 hypothetical protein [Stygiobacter electus]
MVRAIKKTIVDKSKFIVYKKIAESFYQSSLSEIKFERWNSAGVLIIHSAIAFADSITIKKAGIKSRSENHIDVVRLIDAIIPDSDSKKNSLNQLERLIAHKTSVSYSGEPYDKKDIEKLFKHLENFKTWAIKIIND